PPAPEGAKIEVRLADATGNSITEVNPLRAGSFTVKVTSPNGSALPQRVVTAETTIGLLIPQSGTALTDNNGEALFVVQADNVNGAGTLTATAEYEEITSLGSINFSVATELPFSITPQIFNSDNVAVTKADTGDRLTLEVSLTDDRFNQPVQEQVITVDIGELGTLAPVSGNAVTNADGVASFFINVGNLSGAFPIVANAIVPGGGATSSLTLSVDQATRRLGYIDSEGSFVEGVIKISPAGQISPGGTATLSVSVVDETLRPTNTEETLTITSSCLFGDLATLDPDSPLTLGSSITVGYTVQGCTGEDVITATLSSSGAEASGVVEVAPVTADRIIFDSAVPELIALRGTGAASNIPESALVSFTVSDGTGNAVSDARVNFSLSQSVGGLALECREQDVCRYTSDANRAQGRSSFATTNTTPAGVAVGRVLAGSVTTPVQVLAYVDLNDNGEQDLDEPSSASKTLVVSSGVPDQNSISLSATVLNIESAYNIDGKISQLSVRMADAFNNPVPDGTAAIFSTELGSIAGSCNTTNGACSVDWTSQSPRSSDTVERFSQAITINENLNASTPNRYSCPSHNKNHGPCPDDIGDPTVNPPGAPRGGRSTVLVSASGDESFADQNGNGKYDEGELWTNLTEAFVDHNEDGIYTPAQRGDCGDAASADDVCLAGLEETFLDRNGNNLFDLNNTPAASAGSSLPDGQYNGALCSLQDEASGICSRNLVDVRDSLVLVNGFSDAERYEILLINQFSRSEPSSLYENTFYNVYVADVFNNSPPPGSTIDFEGSGDCEPVTESQPVPDTNKAGAFASTLVVSTKDYAQSLEDAESSDLDFIALKLTLPNGSFTTKNYSCVVYRCADDPSQFPQFSPPPPSC
ncbi:MAG: hypothetical protein L7U64_05900, partial [Luminiphilus sp.]|nr:hypothetical protein [Luminiphilus sp.]